MSGRLGYLCQFSWRLFVRSHPRMFLGALVAAIILATVGRVIAQPNTAVLFDGNAVVTSFSGAQPPTAIPPGADPLDHTFIDIKGAVARVIDLQAPGAPPQAQLFTASKLLAVSAGQVGQVFALALDNATPPNVYLAATSVYGLPITADQRGSAVRLKQGAPNAHFMPGLFGPNALKGGPGSIWRIDGATGEVRLFTNVTLDGAPNSGPGLGGLAFDPVSNSLFVSDRQTGMIHRFDMAGVERGRFDHGMQGRPTAGMPAVAFDPAKRLQITSPKFRPADSTTWGYAQPSRRIFGLGVHEGRLYYAVAEALQIWSVGLARDGGLGTDARLEIVVPPGVNGSEISKITFDAQGRMLLAGRGPPSVAYDFSALAAAGAGRVLRYTRVISAGEPQWQAVPDQYAIGLSTTMRAGNGGVAVGYGYDANGLVARNICGGFVWSTGEQLRVTEDRTLAAQLAPGGPALVNGLQGTPVEKINGIALQSYFIDLDDRFDDAGARGHLGDIVIFGRCREAGIAQLPAGAVTGLPGIAPQMPPLEPPPGQQVLPGGAGQVVPPDGQQVLPGGGGQVVPGGQQVLPGGGQQVQPGGGQQVLPGGGQQVQPGGGQQVLPGGGQQVQPGGGQQVQPGGDQQVQPGGAQPGQLEALQPGQMVPLVAPDVVVEKRGPASCEPGKTCGFVMTIRGANSLPFKGTIGIEDVPPAGWTFSEGGKLGLWDCPSALHCVYNVMKNPQWPANGFTNSNVIGFDISFNVPPDEKQKEIKNCVTARLNPADGKGGQITKVACVDVSIGHPPKLKVTKVLDKASCAPGEQCNFTVTIKNEGQGDYTGFLTVWDHSDHADQVHINSVSAPGWNCVATSASQKVTSLFDCYKSMLAAGETASFSVKATIAQDATAPTIQNCGAALVYDKNPADLSYDDKLGLARDFLASKGYQTSAGGPWSEGDKKAIIDYKTKNPIFFDPKGKPDVSGDVTDGFLRALTPAIPNASSADDLKSCVEIAIKEPGLKISKDHLGGSPATAACTVGTVCKWHIRISGNGATPYTKPIKIEESLPPGFKLVAASVGWTCTGDNKVTCTHAPANLTASSFLDLEISARVDFVTAASIYPVANRYYEIKNCAKVVYDDPKQYQREPAPPAPAAGQPIPLYWEACDRQNMSQFDINNWDYSAAGSGPCYPPNCSYYEFTITGREPFARGPLTQRITLPPGSALSAPRFTKSVPACAAGNWSCTKIGAEPGGAFACSIAECALAPGEQVTMRIEGSVAPDLKEPPPAPIEKTACGDLEWTTPGIDPVTNKKKACATITVLARPAQCAPGYLRTSDGQCCQATSLTATGQCCPAGTRPVGQTCVAGASPSAPVPAVRACTGGRLWDGRSCVCPAEQKWNGRNCIARRPPAPACTGGQFWNGQSCACPEGTLWNGRRCVVQRLQPPVPRCMNGKVLQGNRCVCPPGTTELRDRCVRIPTVIAPSPGPQVPQLQQLQPQQRVPLRPRPAPAQPNPTLFMTAPPTLR